MNGDCELIAMERFRTGTAVEFDVLDTKIRLRIDRLAGKLSLKAVES